VKAGEGFEARKTAGKRGESLSENSSSFDDFRAEFQIEFEKVHYF
jgi:hypothetical protein